MIQVRTISIQELEEYADTHKVSLPIEQTALWSEYQATIQGRKPWGCVTFEEDGKTCALASFFDYKTHGYHFLHTAHGPVWYETPTEAQETEAMEALREYVKERDKKEVFLRINVLHDLDLCRSVLSTSPYNQTVIIDISSGNEDEILSRMKGRGRRDVRKSLRECPATFADETEIGTRDFSEYYEIMLDTAKRDDFVPSPQSDYENMLRILGPEHCRLFAGRIDGRVITWTIATISGIHAVRYYGASRSESARTLATDGLIFFECCTLGKQGCVSYDQMGIGNDFSPTLKGLNTFKTKFSKEIVNVAPNRDVPLRTGFYDLLASAQRLRKH